MTKIVSKSPNQAGMPRGLIGRLLAQIMARYNNPDNRWTISLLDIGGEEQVLEVGFGPGAAIESLTKLYPSTRIIGVDHSETMLKVASTRNQQAISAGTVTLQLGSVMNLPFANSNFDKAFSINCVYFWEKPVQGLRELHRVLKPGGRLAVTVRDKNRDAYKAFRPEKLKKMLHQAGFTNIEIATNGVPAHPLICAIGMKIDFSTVVASA
jgi:ubiquinone/menaquinone biosynthesis C-methylase UbiE